MLLAKQLNYERSIQPGKAVFFYKTATDGFVPLEADVKSIRGQKCGFSEAYSPGGEPKNRAVQDLAYSNPVRVENVTVPPLVDAIYCRFNLRAFANSLEPFTCDDSDTYNRLKSMALLYKAKGGYSELANRYARNILLGKWLFRNEEHYPVSIEVVTSKETNYRVGDCQNYDWHSKDKKFYEQLSPFAEELATALTNPRLYWSAEVTAKISAKMGEEIFPSQQLTGKAAVGETSKLFCKLRLPDGREAVTLNMEKIGAGIQKIDDWFSDDADYRLRVHEYGADPKRVIAQRRPENHNDFYSLLSQAKYFSEKMASEGELTSDDHYLMSVLIKGGMFQKGGKTS